MGPVQIDRLIRQARRAAGLSQADLARRARTSQSAVARYERAVATPSLATLERLLRACGRPLQLTMSAPRQSSSVARRMTVSSGRRLLERNRRRLLAAARRNGARAVRLFGSAARGDESASSDVDLLVELEPDRTLLDLVAFQQDASDILGVRVDAATPEILRAGVRERVLAEAIPV